MSSSIKPELREQYHYNIITRTSYANFKRQLNKPVKIIIFHVSAMTSQGDTRRDMLDLQAVITMNCISSILKNFRNQHFSPYGVVPSGAYAMGYPRG
jgi:hypothetical protein